MSNSPPSEKDIGRLYKNYNYFLDWGPIVHYRTVKWNGDKWAFHDVLCREEEKGLTPSEYSSVLLYPITSLTKKRRS
jgi:predicted Mrr-cat superfamily restriction endonuclease